MSSRKLYTTFEVDSLQISGKFLFTRSSEGGVDDKFIFIAEGTSDRFN